MNELKPEDVKNNKKLSHRIREYVNDLTVSDHYGDWGILRADQRRMIRALCDECDAFEKDADHLAEQYEALLREKNAEIEKLRKDIAACQKSTEYWYGRYAEAQLRINEYADMLMDEKEGGE